jgi:hypothetical protein
MIDVAEPMSGPHRTTKSFRAASATPPQYQFGNAGNNELRGPNFSELDFAMAKNFAVGEKRRIEFRAELSMCSTGSTSITHRPRCRRRSALSVPRNLHSRYSLERDSIFKKSGGQDLVRPMRVDNRRLAKGKESA